MENNIPSKPQPPLIPYRLRCANATLYLGCMIIMLAACAWHLVRQANTIDIIWVSVAAVVGTLWALYYGTLRYTLTTEGITRKTLFSRQYIAWQDLSTWQASLRRDQEQATCRLSFTAADGTCISMSSEQLPLHQVMDLYYQLQGLETPEQYEYCPEPRDNSDADPTDAINLTDSEATGKKEKQQELSPQQSDK